MELTVGTTEYLDTVCALLAGGKTNVPVPVTGASMTPFLHPGDTVSLAAVAPPLRRGDILLYRRKNGQYVLHRIVKIKRDGSLVMLGDGQTEREMLTPDAVCARAVRVLHKGNPLTPKSLRWRFFATVWIYMVPLRRPLTAAVARLRRRRR